LVLIAIAIRGLWRVRRAEQIPVSASATRGDLGLTYARFVGLTIINPATIVYFAAVIIGLGVADDLTPVEGALFALGAFLASLSWQTLLAGAGALARHRLSGPARVLAAVLGNLVIVGIAIVILAQ
jgi:arginine exporter protein ArgO